jgi:hypothetical protein
MSRRFSGIERGREKHEEEVAIDKMKLRVESSFSIQLTEKGKA